MPTVYLVEMLPVRKVDGSLYPLRYSSSPLHTITAEGQWLPRLKTPYRRSLQVFDGAFGGQPQDFSSVEVAVQTGDDVSAIVALGWDGRRVRVWRGQPDMTLAQMELMFDGDAENVEAQRGVFKVNLRGPGYALTRDLLSAVYDGSGGAQGTGDMAGNLRPMALGLVTNATPVYVDKSRGIFQWHGYGYAHGIATPGAGQPGGVYDGGSPLTWDGRIFNTYGELEAATIEGGKFAQCLNLGMARHGGEPIDNLTVDAHGAGEIQFGSYAVGNILRYLAGVRGGARVREDTMQWINAALPHDLDNYITEQTSIESVCRDMMLKLGGYTWWTPDGQFTAGLVRRGGAPSLEVGRANIVSLGVRPTAAPMYRRRMGYRRSWRVQPYSELRTPREVKPRGAYLASNTYSFYDLVTLDADTWLHIGETDTTGVRPVEGPVWTKFGSGVNKTSQLIDDANLGLTALWPSVSGVGRPTDYADVTANNTSQYVAGQGALATKDKLTYNGPYLDGFGTFAGLGELFFGSPLFREQSGGASATLGAFKTILGTAAYFANQGALATLSSLLADGPYISLPGRLLGSPEHGPGYLAASTIAWTQGYTVQDFRPQEPGSNITENRTAAYFSGQGALATLSGLSLGSPYLSGFGSLAGTDRVRLGSGGGMVDESNSYWLTSGIVVTSQGTAQYVTGQGALATLSQVGQGNLENLLSQRVQPFPGDGRYLLASRMAWAEGDTVQDFKPQDRGANVTENRTAAYFSGQGALATLSSLSLGGGHLSGFGGLAASSFVQFGASTTVRREDGSSVTDTLVVTAVGTAAYIANQGSLATKSRVGDGDYADLIGSSGSRASISGDNGFRFYSPSGRLRAKLGGN